MIFSWPRELISISCKGFSKEILPVLINVFNEKHIIKRTWFFGSRFTRIEWAGVQWMIEETAEFSSVVTAVYIINNSLTDEDILFNILKNGNT